MIKVTVVIPYYKKKKYIKYFLNSVLNQTIKILRYYLYLMKERKII